MSERKEDSTPSVTEAAKAETATDHADPEDRTSAAVAPYWARPHGRVRGVLTGHRP